MKPLAIDLFCGLGGWAEGFLSEGYDVVGFDTVRHDYGTGGYPGQLVLQDVLTLHGRQFRRAAVIVASPPCTEFSYRGLPWGRVANLCPPDIALFRAAERIAREAGVPIVIENVRSAERFVGPARAHVGSFYLWGDIPALLPVLNPEKGFSLQPKGQRKYETGPNRLSSRGPARKEWSAKAAKIPFPLAQHIARVFKP